MRTLQQDDGDFEGDIEEVIDEQIASGEEEERAILCAQCGHEVTSERHKIAVDGGFEHSFANPAGVVYHIGCFGEAPGCGPTGRESGEFTWFEGYTWQVAVCRGCMTHLGWKYQSERDSFFGLILPRLQESGE